MRSSFLLSLLTSHPGKIGVDVGMIPWIGAYAKESSPSARSGIKTKTPKTCKSRIRSGIKSRTETAKGLSTCKNSKSKSTTTTTFKDSNWMPESPSTSPEEMAQAHAEVDRLQKEQWKTVLDIKDPRILVIDDFLSEEEADYVKAVSEERMEAFENGPIDSDQFDASFGFNFGKSTTVGTSFELPVDTDPILRSISLRQLAFLQIPNHMHSSFRVRRYRVGQGHPPHVDWWESFVDREKPTNLILTFNMYLTDAVGGETGFPLVEYEGGIEDGEVVDGNVKRKTEVGKRGIKQGEMGEKDHPHIGTDGGMWARDDTAGISSNEEDGLSVSLTSSQKAWLSTVNRDTGVNVTAKKGRMAIWSTCNSSMVIDEKSEHLSYPVRSGEKWLATTFVYGYMEECRDLSAKVDGGSGAGGERKLGSSSASGEKSLSKEETSRSKSTRQQIKDISHEKIVLQKTMDILLDKLEKMEGEMKILESREEELKAKELEEGEEGYSTCEDAEEEELYGEGGEEDMYGEDRDYREGGEEESCADEEEDQEGAGEEKTMEPV